MQASWNGVLIAEASADEVRIVENSVYFPLSAVRQDYLQPSTHPSVCGWKGVASYYDVVVDGKVNFNAALIYREPREAASQIAGMLAFWKGVTVQA